MRARVLITDAQERAMVAACRSLVEGGYEVCAAATARPAAGHWSRYPSKRLNAFARHIDEHHVGVLAAPFDRRVDIDSFRPLPAIPGTILPVH